MVHLIENYMLEKQGDGVKNKGLIIGHKVKPLLGHLQSRGRESCY